MLSNKRNAVNDRIRNKKQATLANRTPNALTQHTHAENQLL